MLTGTEDKPHRALPSAGRSSSAVGTYLIPPPPTRLAKQAKVHSWQVGPRVSPPGKLVQTAQSPAGPFSEAVMAARGRVTELH